MQKNIQKQVVRHFFVKNRGFNDGYIMELLYLCRIISSSKLNNYDIHLRIQKHYHFSR